MRITVFIILVALVASCKAVTLADLFNGGSIQVGDALLNNWQPLVNSITGNDSLLRTTVNAANVIMTVNTSDTFNPAIVFTANPDTELTVLQTGGVPTTLTLAFRFDVTITNSAVSFSGVGLTAFFQRSTNAPDDSILASVHEILYTDPSISVELGSLNRYIADGDGLLPGQTFDQSGQLDTAFFPQRTSLTIVKDVNAQVEKSLSKVGTLSFSQNFPLVLRPTNAPTLAPTLAPTRAPTLAPTRAPTRAPTLAPTRAPTRAPTLAPTLAPTRAPTLAPTNAPTEAPTVPPSKCEARHAQRHGKRHSYSTAKRIKTPV